MVVRPDQQGRGVGNRLLYEAERRAVDGGASELALDTSEGAHHLIDWYGRKGFALAETVQWRGKTYRSVIMSKPLRSA
ncbi:GNAT family N-acetyltransferase [Consotaella aegiceratis]|uniref:GNAT family N-acetyltransferase n=1 Tax=Consotaella aegiceratis TaxID=3097961 RepID=UPI002F40AE30